jgi:glutamate-1-semialdehyde 2,1-aminomutase
MPERPGAGPAAVIDADRVAGLIARERAAYAERHPSSRAAFAAAGANLLGGVPMTWMLA